MSQEAVDAFGGIDKCFAAEPIPDGVWQRMQGKTFKENPYIGRDDLRHIRAHTPSGIGSAAKHLPMPPKASTAS